MSRALTTSRHAGFTLIELMIVVVIMAILVAIAVPSYRTYTVKANRSAAQQLMLEIASKEEAYLLDARAYVATMTGTNSLKITRDGWDCTTVTTKCSNTYYDVTVAASAGPPPSHTVSATPKTSTMQSGDGTLTLTNLGVKGPSGKW